MKFLPILFVSLVLGLTGAGAADLSNQCAGPDGLVCAVRDNDYELVEKLLNAGISPNQIGSSDSFVGRRPLNEAVPKGNLKLASLLLAKGADPNLADGQESGGFTPLALAVAYGFSDITEELLKHGADPNIASGVWPALFWAVEGPDGSRQQGVRNALTQLHIVKMLIAAGANVNYPDKSSEYGSQHAIDRAIFCGDIAMVKFLLASGAVMERKEEDPRSPSVDWTPLQWAVNSEEPEMVAFLLSLPRNVYIGSIAGALKRQHEILAEERDNGWNDELERKQQRSLSRIGRMLHAARAQGRP
jgi:ankyrin repeat protein